MATGRPKGYIFNWKPQAKTLDLILQVKTVLYYDMDLYWQIVADEEIERKRLVEEVRSNI